ncbi:MAG: 4-hydroxyproline epimerase [Flavobacteriaceae bacterium]
MKSNARHTFECVEAYTAGNPVRLVKGPAPTLKGKSMAEKRMDFMQSYDWIRSGLMYEPHGHDMMSGSFYYPPIDPKNDVAVLFIETSGCLPMCGHGLIGTLTVLLEEKLIHPKQEGQVRVETPAGLIVANYTQKNSKVLEVTFANVASYLAAENLSVSCSGLGNLVVDVAYGGNFYAIVDPQKNFQDLAHHSASDLVAWSREIRATLNQKFSFAHLEDSNIKGCSHVLWTGKPKHPKATARNAVFYGEKAIDRSPCGTGTSSRMAQWAAKGKLNVGNSFVHESIIGSLFTGTLLKNVTLNGHPAIVPQITGSARIIGYSQRILDPNDPYVKGFQVL